MYQRKHSRNKKNRWNKPALIVVSLLLIATMTLGGTLAYIFTATKDVQNTFTPSKVTTFVEEETNDGVKTNVKIKNTGDTDAYIRAAVVVTWQDKDGNVYGTRPIEGTDYTISWTKAGWILGEDGFYYYTESVACVDDPTTENVYENMTGVLFTDCTLKAGVTPPAGYNLAVEIIGSGIQSKGMGTNEDGDPTKPVVLAWGVDPSTLK